MFRKLPKKKGIVWRPSIEKPRSNEILTYGNLYSAWKKILQFAKDSDLLGVLSINPAGAMKFYSRDFVDGKPDARKRTFLGTIVEKSGCEAARNIVSHPFGKRILTDLVEKTMTPTEDMRCAAVIPRILFETILSFLKEQIWPLLSAAPEWSRDVGLYDLQKELRESLEGFLRAPATYVGSVVRLTDELQDILRDVVNGDGTSYLSQEDENLFEAFKNVFSLSTWWESSEFTEEPADD